MIDTANRTISTRQASWDAAAERSLRTSGDLTQRMVKTLSHFAGELAADHLGIDPEDLTVDDVEHIHATRHYFVRLALGSEVIGLRDDQIARHRTAGDLAVFGG